MESNDLEDNILIKKIKNGDELAMDYLMSKYKTLVNSICRRYFLVGGEQDDLIQEGMIGLYKACMGYVPKEHSTFKTFAYLCIQRQIQSAIRKDNRLKSFPLNVASSLDDDSTGSETPESRAIENEKYNEIIDKIKKTLSKYEFDVFKFYLDGYKIEQIAKFMNRDYKSVDNALVRLKSKLNFLRNTK